MNTTLKEIIVEICERFLVEGKIKPGKNGPYEDSETQVRNIGHWIITFSMLNEWNPKEIYQKKIESLAESLIQKINRPYGYSFYHRDSSKKDKCNGLIGQAWTIESLYFATKSLKEPRFRKIAEELILQHIFNQKEGLWHILEIDGSILPIDNTFNHQLWFAASSSYFLHNSKIRNNVNIFLEKIFENHTMINDGLIFHRIEKEISNPQKTSLKKIMFRSIKQSILMLFSYRRYVKTKQNNNNLMLNKSIGYQTFNTYAFATLKQNLPDHKIWKSDRIQNYLNYLFSEEYKRNIANNIYALPYNAPGFEIPYTLNYLSNMSADQKLDISNEWIMKQFETTFNSKSLVFDKNTNDSNNLTARIYELLKLPLSIIEKITIQVN